MGIEPPVGTRNWSERYFQWLRTVELEHLADRVVFAGYLAEVTAAGERIKRLEAALHQCAERMISPRTSRPAGRCERSSSARTNLKVASTAAEIRLTRRHHPMGLDRSIHVHELYNPPVRCHTYSVVARRFSRPILLPASSLNQMLPSAPTTTRSTPALGVGIGYRSVTCPSRLMRTISLLV